MNHVMSRLRCGFDFIEKRQPVRFQVGQCGDRFDGCAQVGYFPLKVARQFGFDLVAAKTKVNGANGTFES